MEERETRIVGKQLGRPLRGRTEVAARCHHGLPAVIKTHPRLDDGEPFPTLYYLTCPAAIRACGRLEGSGMMRELNARLAADPAFADAYRAAHVSYVAERDALDVLPGAPGAGGMPERVKCLHSLYAHEAATKANPIGAIVAQEIEPIDCPGPCVEVSADGEATVVPGHPHLRA